MKLREKNLHKIKAEVLNRYAVEAFQRPVDLELLAKQWGVSSIQERDIASDGMLLPGRQGYTIVLRANRDRQRKRFSLAHELGHLLLQKCELSDISERTAKHRNSASTDWDEERLCDELAAEILMPKLAFEEDGWLEGWSIRNLRTLAQKYATSIPATAIRMIDLMPEVCLLGVWKITTAKGGQPSLQWSHCNAVRYGVPSSSVVSIQRMGLVLNAWEKSGIHSGVAPVVDKQERGSRPFDVPSEAQAWGQGEYKQIMVFYYPERSSFRN